MDAASGNLRIQRGSPAVDRGVALDYTRDLEGLAVPIDGNADGEARPDAGGNELSA